jgi:methionyl-tRNA synthetase
MAMTLKQAGVDPKEVNWVVQADANPTQLFLDGKSAAVFVAANGVAALMKNPANKGHVIHSQAVEEPWKVIKTDRERAATVLNVGLRLVDALKVIFTPFLPFTSQQVHEMLGHDGFIAGPLEFREVTEEGGRKHRVLTGDYASWVGSWAAPELPVGQKLREPKVIFRKLDLEQVLEAEG